MVPRLMAVAALAAAVVVAVVVLLSLGGGGGGGDSSHRRVPVSGYPESASRARLPKGVAPVRNAKPQPGWRHHSGPVPILRYHVVGVAPPATSDTELFVPAADFRAQMDWLEAHGFEAVGLETVEHAWFDGATLPAKPVVLTFDGIRGHLLDAVVPDLRRRGWPADLVVDDEALPPGPAVARLIALGWDLEPSGPDPALARRHIRARFPARAANFAFPQGDSSSSDTTALEAAGFTGATATGGGLAEAAHPFDLPRITIFNASRVSGFAEAIHSHGEGVGA
jgi:peptidoglycan/xylan/chitin deacetylase (PgdA/CDA1 family)